MKMQKIKAMFALMKHFNRLIGRLVVMRTHWTESDRVEQTCTAGRPFKTLLRSTSLTHSLQRSGERGGTRVKECSGIGNGISKGNRVAPYAPSIHPSIWHRHKSLLVSFHLSVLYHTELN